MKVQKTVLVETCRMAVCCLVLAAVMLGVCAPAGYLDARAVYGALLGTLIAVLNFFALGLSLQRALASSAGTKLVVHASYSARMLLLFAVLAVCLYLDFCNPITLLLPLVFPRLAIFGIGLTTRRRGSAGGDSVG